MTDSSYNFDEFLSRLASANKPGSGHLLHRLSDEAIMAVGRIISAWNLLDGQINREIECYREHPDTPASLAQGDPRTEFRWRLAYLREITGHALKNARPNAVSIFHQNLDRITACKGVRDALAHGSYGLCANPGDISVIYKGRKQIFTAKRLSACADQISKRSGFFMAFELWLQAPRILASQGKSDGPKPAG